MKYVLLYEGTPDFMSKVPARLEGHRALWRKFQTEGSLLMVGPLMDPPPGSAMGIFRTRESAEQFVKEDPFVSGGVVARWSIREWNEVLLP